MGGFIAFPGKKASRSNPRTQDANNGLPFAGIRALPTWMQVDRYLWEVYQRAPTKNDHSGDFTWKDPAAAKRMGLSLPEYVIGGMDPDFREQLYHAGQAMDAAGIQWSMLSAFRDDYRQGLASGYKAGVGNSLHGGSRATGGYGHGRAIDITGAGRRETRSGNGSTRMAPNSGSIVRMPGPDPAHVQSAWRLAQDRSCVAREFGFARLRQPAQPIDSRRQQRARLPRHPGRTSGDHNLVAVRVIVARLDNTCAREPDTAPARIRAFSA